MRRCPGTSAVAERISGFARLLKQRRGNGMSAIENVSRRRFLTGGIIAAGALVLAVRYYPGLSSGDKLPHDTNADHATLHPSVYLGIDADGAVWIVASRSEMGTTSRTTLPLIVAD